jgi:2-aminobenzoate-CoA ligase
LSPETSPERTLGRASDTFAVDHLPPRELWPVLDYSGLPELGARTSLNAAMELLDHWVSTGQGDRTAIRCETGAWTYRELFERANQVAHVLVEDLGVVPGNRVLLRGPNSPMMAALWYGVLKAGGICVTTMPLLRSRELCQIAEKARIGLAITDARLTGELTQAAAATPCLTRIVRYNSDDDSGTLEDLMRRKPVTFTNVDTHADDVAIIAFTSGTTGLPKGTMHGHRDLLAICDTFPVSVLQASPDDLFCGSPPLAFTFGLGGILLFPMRIGAATLLLEQASPPLLIRAIRDHGATVCFTAPTAYRAMLGMLADVAIPTLRKCVSAGEALPRATFEAWREATGIAIIDGIGATEMLHIFISAPEDEIRPGSTGRVVPGYTARIVDDDGNEVPAGGIGRLAVRGPTGCRYLDDTERQKAYVKDGWNLTGDTYSVDADGYFWYQARSDDMIVSSGYNISGPEVENALLEHPAVAECGVVGEPDEDRGSIVKAWVVVRAGHEPDESLKKELQEFVKAEIAPYKYPRRIEFVASLPRTETGKLQRFRLRAESR